MTMQAVVAGGVPPLTDGKREADEDNPHGYLEFEPAIHLRDDTSWVPLARGHAVKLALPLLPFSSVGRELPGHRYLSRSAEVVASQRRMLARLGRTGRAANLSESDLENAYRSQEREAVEWLSRRPGVACLPLWCADVQRDPEGAASRIGGFLDRPFDRSLARVRLYRICGASSHPDYMNSIACRPTQVLRIGGSAVRVHSARS
jgi:hypothetical protein